MEIDIMPLKELLDPQGMAVIASLKNLSFRTIKEIRIGKHIDMEIDIDNYKKAKEEAISACKKLLVNPIVESYQIKITKI